MLVLLAQCWAVLITRLNQHGKSRNSLQLHSQNMTIVNFAMNYEKFLQAVIRQRPFAWDSSDKI